MFSPDLEWSGGPQAAGLAGSAGSLLNGGVSIWCSVACEPGDQRQMRRDDGICAGEVENYRRREEGERRDKMKERRQRNS